MIEIKGKYNEAKIFTDVVDSASIAQVQELCNQEFTAGSRIRLMPDIHAGAGCTIGTTMTITDKVVPNLVGVDIGCGMETTRIREGRLELQKLDKLIYEKIPSGFSIRDKAHRYLDEIDLSELCCAHHVDLLRAEKSIGTLGGGNHFIEVDKDDEGNLYIVVHSGSRHLGVEVASYYQEAGYKVLNRTDDASLQTLVAQMKAEGREKEIQKELKKLKNLKQTSIPKALAYVSGELFEQYIKPEKQGVQMMETYRKEDIRRGDIYYADLRPVVGSEQGGIRPVVILQNNVGNRHSPTVIAAAITSRKGKHKLPTHVNLDAPVPGLYRDSIILLEQLRTIDKSRLRDKLGSLGEDQMCKLDHALEVSVGLLPIYNTI